MRLAYPKDFDLKNFVLFGLLLLGANLLAQSGIIRGNVLDEETGEPIIYGTVQLKDTERGTNTDLEGFFTFTNLEPGVYTLIISYTGYATKEVTLEVKNGIVYERIYLASQAVNLGTVNVSASRERARSDVQVSKVSV
ncbi:MAG: carboxypeptidase-like regulatory domain-containing protein, partial [Bacteroidetes bacterium]